MAGDGGDFLGGIGNAIGSGVSTAASDVGNFVGGIGNDVSSLFGGSTPQAASQTGALASAGQVAGSAAPSGASGLNLGPPGMSAAGSASALPGGGGSMLDQIVGGGMTGDASDASPGSGMTGSSLVPVGQPSNPAGLTLNPTSADLTQPSMPTDLNSLVPGIAPQQPGILDKLGINLGKAASNPITDLSAGGLVLSALNGMRTPSSVKSMQGLENRDATQAATEQALASTSQQGLLPGPAMQALTQKAEAAKAEIRARYASMGQSGSSAEAEDLANVNSTFASDQFQIAQGLATQGLSAAESATGQSSSLLQQILQANTAQGSAFGTSLSNFMRAMTSGQPQTYTLTPSGS